MDPRIARHLAAAVAAATLALTLALVTGCAATTGGGGTSGSTGGGSAKSAVTLTEADKGKTVEVAKGGTVAVSLKGNPTTGYDWLAQGNVPPILAKQGESSFKAESGLIGAGGVVTITYKAVETGEGELKLAYMRSFEPTSTPAQTWAAKIVVK
jgi:predicted secreted protein